MAVVLRLFTRYRQTAQIIRSDKFLLRARVGFPCTLTSRMETNSSSVENTNGSNNKQDAGPDAAKVVISMFTPPLCKGMTTLERSAFEKDFQIPAVFLQGENWSETFKTLKPYLLKVRKIKPAQDCEDSSSKKVYLNPETFETKDAKEMLQFLKDKCQSSDQLKSISYETVRFNYENWSHTEILNSVLPDDEDKVSSFSKVGHLIHLNLRDHLLPYKTLIGEVLIDKIPNTRTVVNKLNTIDSTFRNFQMEVLAGDEDTVVTTKHSKCDFQFDFAHVYWNTRLGTEHERIHGILKKGDVLYDVFAGVGPFAVPSGKLKVHVLANDLNPASFKWLQRNIQKNKVSDYVKAYNLDGREFITTIVRQDLKERLASNGTNCTFHVVMNLPAIAVDFLDAFWNILPAKDVESLKIHVHVYCFIKLADDYKKDALQLVKDSLGFQFDNSNVDEVSFVRNVAPNKEMLRVSFQLPHNVLTSCNASEGTAKKRKLSEFMEDNL